MPELAYNLPSAWSAQGCGLMWPQAWRRSGVSFLLELAAGPGAGWGGSLAARGRTDTHLTQSSVVLWVGTNNQRIWLLNGGENKEAHRREVSREAFVLWKFRETVPGRP